MQRESISGLREKKLKVKLKAQSSKLKARESLSPTNSLVLL
jgi:hypothetical protein